MFWLLLPLLLLTIFSHLLGIIKNSETSAYIANEKIDVNVSVNAASHNALNSKSNNNFKEYDWNEFIDLLKNYGKELYLDDLCSKMDLNLNTVFVGGWTVDPSYIYVEDNYLVLISYNSVTDSDIDKTLEDFLDIEKLFKGEDDYIVIVQKIIDYISK